MARKRNSPRAKSPPQLTVPTPFTRSLQATQSIRAQGSTRGINFLCGFRGNNLNRDQAGRRSRSSISTQQTSITIRRSISPPLIEALETRTGNRLVRSDWVKADHVEPDAEARQEIAKLPDAFTSPQEVLYIDYQL